MRSAGHLSVPRSTMVPERRASKRRSGSWYALVALLLSIGWVTPASGSAEELGDGSGLFEQVEPLAIRLEAPWRELWRRPEAGATRPGRLVYPSSTGEEVILDVNIKTRGKSRLEACRFPMLTLEFDADQIGGTIFADQRVVHLTVQCQERTTHLQYLVLEELLYRVFALLSDDALGTRLVSLEYVDPASKRRPVTTEAFLLEDIGLAAGRRGLEWRRPKSIKISALEETPRALFVMFQYLIGNTDWSLRIGPEGELCCHNTALIGSSGELADLIPIPFDLDSAGLIDVDYIDPLHRVYRGYCDFSPHLVAALESIREVRGELSALFEDSDQLSARSRKSAVKYLDSFFAIVDDPEKYAKKILGECR